MPTKVEFRPRHKRGIAPAPQSVQYHQRNISPSQRSSMSNPRVSYLGIHIRRSSTAAKSSPPRYILHSSHSISCLHLRRPPLLSRQRPIAMDWSLRFMHSIGGLVVKLAVANRCPLSRKTSDDIGQPRVRFPADAHAALISSVFLFAVCLPLSSLRNMARSAGLPFEARPPFCLAKGNAGHLDTVCFALCLSLAEALYLFSASMSAPVTTSAINTLVQANVRSVSSNNRPKTAQLVKPQPSATFIKHWWFSGKIGRCHLMLLPKQTNVGQPRVRFPADA
jgi:hypothetical protein